MHIWAGKHNMVAFPLLLRKANQRLVLATFADNLGGEIDNYLPIMEVIIIVCIQLGLVEGCLLFCYRTGGGGWF